MDIGWIGLGKMGIPMAQQLLDAGHTLTVYNRTKEKEKSLTKQGAASAESPKDVLKQAEVTFLMVSDDEATRALFTGKDGLLDADATDKIIVNASTVSPHISREMAKKCEQIGSHYVDAPVSGSVPQAEQQVLVSIAGGEAAIVDKVRPLLECYSKQVVYTGKVGSGNATKLAVNTFLGIITEGLAEVLDFCDNQDLDPQNLMEVLNNGSLHSPFVEMKGKAVLNDNYEAAFTLEHMAKDLRLARESGMDAPVGTRVAEMFSDAEAGFGQEDVIAIFKYLNQT